MKTVGGGVFCWVRLETVYNEDSRPDKSNWELLLESHPAKRILGGWCEMAAIPDFRSQLKAEFCEDRTWKRATPEYPLLEAVVRERVLKILQAGEGLACSDL
jgi:hypothetical protein